MQQPPVTVTPAQPQQVTDQPPPGTPVQPQQQTGQQIIQPGPPQQNPAMAPASTPAQAKPSPATPVSTPGVASFHLDPPTAAPAQGSQFTLNLNVSGGQDIASVPLQITYDSKVVQFVSVSNGSFLSKDGQNVALVHRDDPTTGTLQISAQRPPNTPGVSGTGTVFTLVFTAKEKGTGVIAITTPGARNSQNQSLQVTGSQTAVSVN